MKQHRSDARFIEYVDYLKIFFQGGEAKQLLGNFSSITNEYAAFDSEIEDLFMF